MRRGGSARRCAGKEHIHAYRPGIDVAERVSGMFILIVNLYVLYPGELLHGLGQRLGDTVGAAIGPAIARKINIEHAIGKINPSIANKSVPYGHESLGLLLSIRSLEVLIQRRRDGIGRTRNLP